LLAVAKRGVKNENLLRHCATSQKFSLIVAGTWNQKNCQDTPVQEILSDRSVGKVKFIFFLI
jgi:hypothetical protein